MEDVDIHTLGAPLLLWASHGVPSKFRNYSTESLVRGALPRFFEAQRADMVPAEPGGQVGKTNSVRLQVEPELWRQFQASPRASVVPI